MCRGWRATSLTTLREFLYQDLRAITGITCNQNSLALIFRILCETGRDIVDSWAPHSLSIERVQVVWGSQASHNQSCVAVLVRALSPTKVVIWCHIKSSKFFRGKLQKISFGRLKLRVYEKCSLREFATCTSWAIPLIWIFYRKV